MPKKACYSCWALATLFAAPAVATAICASRVGAMRTVVALLLTATLEAFLVAALARTWRRFFLINFPLFLVSLAFAIYTVVFGVPPGRSIALVLVDTTWEEVIGFLGLVPVALLALLTSLPLIYAALVWQTPPLPIFSGKAIRLGSASVTLSRLLLLACLPFAAYVAWNPADLMDGIGFSPLIGSAMFLGELPSVRADAKGALVTKVPYRAEPIAGEEVHILVIGESARRDSWSAYGYPRPTTPHLDQMKQEVILLQHALADTNQTAWSVPIILTGYGTQQMRFGSIRGTLLDLAHEAGYKTAWLVNQDEGISGFVGAHADREIFIPQIESGLFGRRALDETLLPAFRQVMAPSRLPRFIALHTMGSHWQYNHRYPASARHFSDALADVPGSRTRPLGKGSQEEINAYDDSVLYTDWFLSQIIEQARALNVPSTVVYFPDHGENLQQLDGIYGHSNNGYNRHGFEIPAFVWINEAYRKAHPEKVAALQNNASKQIRSHDVFATEGDLMGIRWPDRVARRSFASDQFIPDVAMPYIAGGSLVSPPAVGR